MSRTVSSDLDLTANSIAFRPSEAELRSFTDAMPQARQTRYGNVNVQTKVLARSKASTYVVTDRPEEHTDQTISREEGRRIARIQDEYIRAQDMLVVDGFIGHDGPFKGDQPHDTEITIIYTPNLTLPGYPDDRLIAVDLEAGVTRVINSDYFGESKKGDLPTCNNNYSLSLHVALRS